ncbi:MAG TPA: Asp-tRNA(Asn)/Glu-tRNA(Gln) amidotransferase subunit GatA [Candidatus Limnocylindrales bacterium]|nr:Asp-tRNA(Asn)/Glu-tRNA(Gln) amidotransferase subunit GatA [Candidatus Limnocylindrales bacterium]
MMRPPDSTRTGAGSRWTLSTASEIADAVREGKASAEEVTRAFLAHADRTSDRLGTWLHRMPEEALRAARAVDLKRTGGARLGALAGVPIAIKDNIAIRGIPTTCGSKILEGYRPPYDAHVIERLREADAIVVGKTNCDEFAMGSSTENSAYHPTRNPWDPSRVPGGSSGGSAAAVAAREAPLALGSDTGGSVRQPAAFCGVYGLKPTYGAVSRYGLVAFASSLDQIGPFARTARDTALAYNAIAGPDARDMTSRAEAKPVDLAALDRGLQGLTFGVPRELLEGDGLAPEIRSCFDATAEAFRAHGARLVDVSLPNAKYSIATYYLIAPAEASSNLARYDGVRFGLRAPAKDLREMYEKTRRQGFGREVRRRILLGTYALSAGYYDAYYLRAQKVRTLIRADFMKALGAADALLLPVTPTTAFGIGEKVEDPLAMYLNDIFSIPASLAGVPALSFPAGFGPTGLPIGLQLVGRPFAEETLLRAARAHEGWNDASKKAPPIATEAAA